MSDEIVKLFQAFPHPLFGVGFDAVSAQDAWGLEMPGFNGLKLDPAPGKGMNRDCIRNDEAEKYFFHFPDGNASITRLLVRKLIPAAIPGSSATDVVLAKADYSKLDEPSSVDAHPAEQHRGQGEPPGRSGHRRKKWKSATLPKRSSRRCAPRIAFWLAGTW